ncbi:EVE domain-containing protein [Umezakia ovalisporum]|jgi:predicted RNA-binding protein with PUA-like domain|uniref:EVE domain-containing protein n=1 Tax=Umezakia ovalisporum TaxID=75695 RepID=UPI0024754E7F|nr:EVE domain-containing protein [Umezakia ovalisporum]MBI1242597.1 EVE domain-containing protein [Nostoc sp. RI_552]MDH6086634.1 EVE domain-containing protein [Umezakia ovalisporum TAC611]
MAYWLLKTEPDKYSYFNLEQDGRTVWDGVNNALALKHIRNMLVGDLVLIYHTGKERQIVGIAEVISQPYADPKLSDSKRIVVDIRAVKRVSVPLSLTAIKQNGEFTDFDLLRLPRLSVVPVSEFYWQIMISLTDSKNN